MERCRRGGDEGVGAGGAGQAQRRGDAETLRGVLKEKAGRKCIFNLSFLFMRRKSCGKILLVAAIHGTQHRPHPGDGAAPDRPV